MARGLEGRTIEEATTRSLPSTLAPAKPRSHRRPGIKRAQVVPHRVRKGKRATLRLSLPQAGTVRITIERTSAPHRGRSITRTVAAAPGKVSIRLPRILASGRYRVTAVVVDAVGSSSRSIARSLIVRPSHR